MKTQLEMDWRTETNEQKNDRLFAKEDTDYI